MMRNHDSMSDFSSQTVWKMAQCMAAVAHDHIRRIRMLQCHTALFIETTWGNAVDPDEVVLGDATVEHLRELSFASGDREGELLGIDFASLCEDEEIVARAAVLFEWYRPN
jgi:hypothetical protein